MLLVTSSACFWGKDEKDGILNMVRFQVNDESLLDNHAHSCVCLCVCIAMRVPASAD